jgi:hypothetical protein
VLHTSIENLGTCNKASVTWQTGRERGREGERERGREGERERGREGGKRYEISAFPTAKPYLDQEFFDETAGGGGPEYGTLLWIKRPENNHN